MLEKLLNWIVSCVLSFFKDFKNDNYYCEKNLMTTHELFYYNIFQDLQTELDIIIQPQVPLLSILKLKKGKKYEISSRKVIKDLNRIIDFGVFTKDYKKLILLIEINDISHKKQKRFVRDLGIRKICENSGIKLITYYPDYSNNTEIIKSRLKKEILSSLN